MRVTVLGGGRVGGAIAADLARGREFEVTVVDVVAERLEALAAATGVRAVRADLSSPAGIADAVDDADLVVGAVPGRMGLATLKAVVAAGRSIVDISFLPEDPFTLDGAARAAGVGVVVDCGIAPGCSNLILGWLTGRWETVERFVCYVGGLPVERRWPWEYRAPFSPADVIEEYTRPARFVRDGREVEADALSEVEHLDFPPLGTLEAFKTDGLRTLLRTVSVPDMVEKTLRYPGHAERMRMLREAGFFATEPVTVGGVTVTPRELTSHLLFPAWELAEGEEDVTVMRIIAEGVEEGRRLRRQWDLLDRYERESGTTSMARTTGYTCTAVVRAVAGGLWSEPGVHPPEHLGREPRCFSFVIAELEKRGVVFRRSDTILA